MKAIGKSTLRVLALSLSCTPALQSQTAPDTTRRTVQEAIYDRPFIGGLERTAVGGYLEANTNYGATDGIGDGFTMELRRFNIFLFSTLGPRIRFLAELEFEHGTQKIGMETAQLDLRVDPAFVLRAGILLPPIGAFNVNHDSPRWNFIDRPIVSTEVLPATLAEVGFGVNGRLAPRGLALTYDLYLTNGLGDGVILNASGRTRLADGKRDEQFAEDNNGSPAVSGRVALQHERAGEFGVSFYSAVYNSFVVEGEQVEPRRGLRVLALDGQTTLGAVEVRGEIAHVAVNVPLDLREVFGSSQIGWHLDLTTPVWRPRLRAFPRGAMSADLRIEYADFNRGRFTSTGGHIGDDFASLVLGASYRPVSGTVLKFNYRLARQHDLQNNPAARSGAFQVGFATYF